MPQVHRLWAHNKAFIRCLAAGALRGKGKGKHGDTEERDTVESSPKQNRERTRAFRASTIRCEMGEDRCCEQCLFRRKAPKKYGNVPMVAGGRSVRKLCVADGWAALSKFRAAAVQQPRRSHLKPSGKTLPWHLTIIDEGIANTDPEIKPPPAPKRMKKPSQPR